MKNLPPLKLELTLEQSFVLQTIKADLYKQSRQDLEQMLLHYIKMECIYKNNIVQLINAN